MIPQTHSGAGMLVFILIMSVVVIVGGLLFFDGTSEDAEQPEIVACPADAKVCADGSVVVREGEGCVFALCPEEKATTTADRALDGCVITGCSGQVCADEEVMTTCEYRPEYACYQSAVCARNPEGVCGWAETPDLAACIAAATSSPSSAPVPLVE